MRTKRLFLLIPVAALACSSSPSPGGSGSSGSSGSCSCDVSYNGVQRTLSCDSSDCVNGVSFTCGKTGDITQGGACSGNPTTGSAGTGGGGAACQASGTFPCGGHTCKKKDQYCDIGDPNYDGAIDQPYICASITWGSGACAGCDYVLAKTGGCFGGLKASCSGDQLTGVTVTCK